MAAKIPTKREKPRTVGPYLLRRVLSERDLLATYVAENPALARTALVRTAAPNVALTEVLKRHLAAEAVLVARAAGDGVALLYEAAPDGTYYAMEDPEGPSLADVRSGEKATEITGPAAMSLVSLMASSVAVVHGAGLVHAAVEPSAFFLSARRKLVLTGFDRARAEDVPAEADQEPERGAASTAYASPEQLVGEPLTPRSDVFSLGVIAYELLAGVHPFAGDKGQGDVAHRIRTERPPPMPDARGIPIDLERLIQRALGKLPRHRPASAGELATEIAAIALPEGRETERQKLYAKLGLREGKASATSSVTFAARDVAEEKAPSLRPVAIRLAVLFAMMLAAGAAFQIAERADSESEKGGGAAAPGYVRVLAHPWAEVWVDGALVDTTPMGRPLALGGGRHTFLFKHPRASEERRVVDVVADATTTLDVTMNVDRPPVDAGVDASP